MCKLRPKVRNGQNLPHESPNFTNFFFRSNFIYNFSHVFTGLTPHYKTVFFLFFSFCYFKLQNVYEHVYLASQIVKWQNGRRSNFYMVKWTLMYVTGKINPDVLLALIMALVVFSLYMVAVEVIYLGWCHFLQEVGIGWLPKMVHSGGRGVWISSQFICLLALNVSEWRLLKIF